MSYIEREAAIKAVCEGCNAEYGEEPCEPSDCTIMQNLRSIPAADARKVVRGRWTLFGRRGIYGVMYECSACHAKYDGRTNFCPNCGAKMEES